MLSPLLTPAAVLAEFYKREAYATCKVVLVSTIMSILTVSGYLAVTA